MAGCTATGTAPPSPVTLAGFKPIYNRARGALDPSSPHARNVALLPFLFYIYAADAGHLQVLTTDFHANTWHARVSCDQLLALKEKLAFTGNFGSHVQVLHKGFSSDDVKVELGGPASAIGGIGATTASLKVAISALGGDPRPDVGLNLELSHGHIASDDMGTLALEIFEAFIQAKGRIAQLEGALRKEKEKCAKVLDAVVHKKASTIHFITTRAPGDVGIVCPLTETGADGCQTPPSSIEPHPLTSSPTLSFSPQSPSLSQGEGESQLKVSGLPTTRVRLGGNGSARSSALKLAVANSYARVTPNKPSVKKDMESDEERQQPSCSENQTGSRGTPSNNCSNNIRALHELPHSLEDLAGLSSGKRKYRDLDPHILAKIDAGGENRSVRSDMWARRHYMEWRKDQGFTEKEIEELPIAEFAETLVKFFCMVKKRSGDLFPSDSLKAMFRGFARILNFHYKKLALQGQHDGPIVEPNKDMLFEKARIACMEAMKYSILNGANVKKSKLDLHPPESEEVFLQHPDNQILDPDGLVRRLVYYAIHQFQIYGNMELYDTTDVEFRRGVDEKGIIYWEYNESCALRYKNKSSWREVVRCSEKDVVLCWDAYVSHVPPKPLENEPRRFFLSPIKRPALHRIWRPGPPRPKRKDREARLARVWFRHQNLSCRTLLKLYRQLGGPKLEELPMEAKRAHRHSLSLLRMLHEAAFREVRVFATIDPKDGMPCISYVGNKAGGWTVCKLRNGRSEENVVRRAHLNLPAVCGVEEGVHSRLQYDQLDMLKTEQAGSASEDADEDEEPGDNEDEGDYEDLDDDDDKGAFEEHGVKAELDPACSCLDQISL